MNSVVCLSIPKRNFLSLPLALLVVPVVIVLGACSGSGGQRQFQGEENTSLAQVVEALPAVKFVAIPVKPSAADVIQAYQRVYSEIPEVSEKHSIGKRLADLEMGRGEQRDIEGESEPYVVAIGLYESLLKTTPSAQLDLIYYQLARAYELNGNKTETLRYLNKLLSEYPQSTYSIEAHFRRGELQFSAGVYQQAVVDYKYVVDHGQASVYARNALYMQGWSLFKLSDLDAAVPSFLNLLGQIMQDGERDTRDSEILEDSLRVLVHTLSYLDGARTLAEHMAVRGKPDWQHIVYQTLAEDYRDNARFLDSVFSLQTFIDQNALDIRAPAFHRQMIDTLIEADFPSEVFPRKQEFVERYGIRSEFWNLHDSGAREHYLQILENYLFELAQKSHSEAQISKLPDAYIQSADWYEQILQTFPEHEDFANVLFLSGEAYTEAGKHEAAVSAYQGIVWEYPENEHAAEAGYAAVLGLDTLLLRSDARVAHWQDKKIAAQIEFALMFPNDSRAPGVQAAAANTLYSTGQYVDAIELASQLLSILDLDRKLRANALLITGHSYFELSAFVEAENAYRKLMPTNDTALRERILASIYKQGELSELSGKMENAVAHYLRAHAEAPENKLAIRSLYDAVAVFEAMQNWDLAALNLKRFRSLYPRHKLSADISRRLAGYYEKSHRWSDAAMELLTLSVQHQDTEIARVAKYHAAELFLLAEAYPEAIEHFRDYAHKFDIPKALNLEAMHHMDQLYQKTNAPDKRRFWLRKKIGFHAALTKGNDASLYSRATSLAAESQYVFAIDARDAYRIISLKLPLKRSLKQKQKALLQSVAEFEKLSEYKVAKYSSAATYEIAELYAALGESLYGSERPAGLNDMELAQYELLLEEQAYPFEEQAISLHVLNQRRSWDGYYDEWVKHSFARLRELMPGRYAKQERRVAYVDELY